MLVTFSGLAREVWSTLHAVTRVRINFHEKTLENFRNINHATRLMYPHAYMQAQKRMHVHTRASAHTVWFYNDMYSEHL